MADVKVELGGRSYDVRIGSDLVANAGTLMKPLLRKETVPIVTDANVHARWGKTLGSALEREGFVPRFLIHEPGEGAKSWQNLAHTVEWLLDEEVERGDNIVALGGGVIGDLTGFAAAILKRGCGFIQLPTTLLAQVDSSVGGKTAINVSAGKNLVGAFHQPALVLADIETLATLPEREMRCGYAEIIKYGLLGDATFFAWCEANSAKVLSHEEDALTHAVTTSVEAKARIVAADERETIGQRALLNLGHTFGHALEAATGYSDKLLHGEAVAAGMVLAARYSVRKGHLSQDDAARITAAIDAAGLPAEISAMELDCSGEELAAHMMHDKKMDAGNLPFVLLKGIGEAYLDRDVSMADIAAFLSEQLQAH